MTNEQKLREALQDADSVLQMADRSTAWKQERDRCRQRIAGALSEPQTSDEGTPTETPLTDAEVERLYGPLSDTFGTSLAGRFAEFTSRLERTLHAKERELAEAKTELKEHLSSSVDYKLVDGIRQLAQAAISWQGNFKALDDYVNAAPPPATPRGDGGEAIGHDKAQELIATHVRQIQILAEQFGYDPAEWLNDETAQNA